jgi:hypothetical protein
MSDKKWYVSLGDGTFVEMDAGQTVALLSDEDVEKIDEDGGDFPLDCEKFPHIHIQELVYNSVWEDGRKVTEDLDPVKE